MLSDDGSPFPSSGVELRLPALLVFLASSLLFSGRVSAAGAEALPELQAAQRAAWQTVAILAHGLTGSDPGRFPGLQAWLKEYRAAGGAIGKMAPNTPLPKVDAERSLVRGPIFWRAFFEQAPGHAGTLLWQGALLLGAGEASRAAYVLLAARQTPDIEPPMLEAMNGLLEHAQRVLQVGAQRVAEAAKLHDQGNPDAAAAALRAVLTSWPANGLAHYELALTALARQYADARQTSPGRSRLSIHSELAPGAEALAGYARARQHDPLLIRAYQAKESGSDPLLVLGKTVRPLWDVVARDTRGEMRDDVLRQLAMGLHEAGIPELALAVFSVVIGREGGYDDADRKFVADNLRVLAPAAADPVMKRLAQTPAQFVRFVLP
jgi:hypothetical protein